MVTHGTYDEAMAALFQKDPAYALDLLNSVLADGDQTELLTALRQVVKAVGGVKVVAAKSHISSARISRLIATDADPALSNLRAILATLGLRLAIQPEYHHVTADLHPH